MTEECLPFVWTQKLAKKFFELKFQHEWLFKEKKQPWQAFHSILLEKGFPKNMKVDHLRKKWSYTSDSYKIAKKTKNKSWKYYKMFDKYYGKNIALDKFDSWNDEWRLKLILAVTEAKALKLEMPNLWKTVEKTLRCQNLPSNCCIQDIKKLFEYLKKTFNRKHRMFIRKGIEEWYLYDAMLHYYKMYEKELLRRLETEDSIMVKRTKADKTDKEENVVEEIEEFQWSKDITESFIQIRLQNEKLFKTKKWAWNDFRKIMIEEHYFPKTLTTREICRKWATIISEYQKAKATKNTSWLYYNILECYYGEGSFSLNPLLGWQEEWVLLLIQIRTDLDHLFPNKPGYRTDGWREVEKELRRNGLPLDCSLLDLQDIWSFLTKTYRWKKKFARKGILTEHWPYFDKMAEFCEIQLNRKFNVKIKNDDSCRDYEYLDGDGGASSDDDVKLFDLKRRLQLQPKEEIVEVNNCRACSAEEGCVNIFEQCDTNGLDLAQKLRVVCGIEVEKNDNLPKQICFNCINELENAFRFREKCKLADQQHRNTIDSNIPTNNGEVKLEIKLDETPTNSYNHVNDSHIEKNESDLQDNFDSAFDNDYPSDVDAIKAVKRPVKKSTRKIVIRRKKYKVKKDRKDYVKVCEICGKHTQNLTAHLDTHSEGKLYSCDLCDKRFKFKSGLTIHKAIHDPQPKKTCEVCGKTFHIMAQYRRHFVYHANERKYACDTCGKRFNTLDILRVHQRMHTDERPFSCADCGKTFRTAGCVSRHKRIVHKKLAKCTNTDINS